MRGVKGHIFFYSLGEKDTLRFEILIYLFTTWLTGEHDAFVVCRSHNHLFVFDRVPVSDCMTLIILPRLFWSKGGKETSEGPVTADVICSDCKERLYY